MPPRSAAKADSSDVQHPDDGDEQLVFGIPLSKAGDAVRHFGSSLLEIADAIDDNPPIAKMFESRLLGSRFREIFQCPSALMAGEPGLRLEAAVSDETREAATPGPAKPKSIKGATAIAAVAAAGIANSSSSGRSSRAPRSRAEEGEKGGAARSAALPSNWTTSASSSSAEVASGRREKRGTGPDDDEGWFGLGQAIDASTKESAASTGRVGARKAGGKGKGVAGPRHPANQDSMEMQAPAQPRLMPSFPLPSSSGFPLTSPPRRAAAQARHRMSSMLSLGAPPVGPPPCAVSAGPRTKASAAARPAELAAAARGPEVEGLYNVKTKGNKYDGGGRATAGGKGEKQAKTTRVNSPSGSAWGTRGMDAPAAKKTKLNDKDTVGGKSGGGGRPGGATGSTLNAGGRTGHGEGTGYGGSTPSRETNAGLRFTLDERVFRFFQAGECREEGCVARMEVHCHRGPACDCTRISGTYLWPSEVKNMSQHQANHLDWTTRPAFGKRVMVEFSDGIFYPGTIHTDGSSAKDLSHPEGRWGVLFDDYTTDRFKDGAADVMLSSRPRLKSIPKKLRDFYLEHENGQRLLIGVQVVAEGDVEAYEGDESGRNEEHSEASSSGPEGNKSVGEKNKYRKPSKHNTPQREYPEREEKGGGAGTLHASER